VGHAGPRRERVGHAGTRVNGFINESMGIKKGF
jgi:hypothetical protein